MECLTGKASPIAWRPWWGAVALCGIFICLAALSPWSTEVLEYRRDRILDGELWRLVTGHLVHLGWPHAAMNVAALVAFVLACLPQWGWRSWAAYSGILALWVSAGLLLFSESLLGYVGFSGVAHGLFVLGLWPMVRRKELLPVVLFAYLWGKLIYEQAWGASVLDESMAGGPVAVDAHLYGAAGAVVILLALGGVHWVRGRRP